MPAGPAVEILPGGGWRMLQPTAIASIPASTRSWEMAGPGMQAVSKVSLAGKAGPLPVNVTRVIPWGLLGNAIAQSLPIVGAVRSEIKMTSLTLFYAGVLLIALWVTFND